MILGDVDNEAMELFKEERRTGTGHCAQFKPAMSGTINKELATITTVLTKASRVWRWIPEAPLIERVVGPTRKSYPYTWDEQDALFGYFPSKWAYGAATFAVNTGVRKEELYGLKWKDLQEVSSLDTYVFILRDTKNGEDRAVICNSLARKSVDAQKDNGKKFVFPRKKVGLDNKVWRDSWEKAGLTSDPLVRKGMHNCRHTFGYRLRAFGVRQEDRDALLGHHNSNITQHYAQPDLARLAEGAERVAAGYQEKAEIIMLRSV